MLDLCTREYKEVLTNIKDNIIVKLTEENTKILHVMNEMDKQIKARIGAENLIRIPPVVSLLFLQIKN